MADSEKGFYLKNVADVKLNTNEKTRSETVFKTKSKKDKRDCLNLRKTLLGTSPRLVILKSAEDLCIKGFDSVKKQTHKQGERGPEPRVSEKLLSDGSSAGQSTPEPVRPSTNSSFCCEYPQLFTRILHNKILFRFIQRASFCALHSPPSFICNIQK